MLCSGRAWGLMGLLLEMGGNVLVRIACLVSREEVSHSTSKAMDRRREVHRPSRALQMDGPSEYTARCYARSSSLSNQSCDTGGRLTEASMRVRSSDLRPTSLARLRYRSGRFGYIMMHTREG